MLKTICTWLLLAIPLRLCGAHNSVISSTSCDQLSQLLEQFTSCCAANSSLASVSYRNKGLKGTLPSSFVPPRHALDFRDNPELCGSIAHLPQEFKGPIALANSQVAVDLGELTGKPSNLLLLGALEWLGQELLAADNLKGQPTTENAYQACILLDNGQYTWRHRAERWGTIQTLDRETQRLVKTKVYAACNSTAQPHMREWVKAVGSCYFNVSRFLLDGQQRHIALQAYNSHLHSVAAAPYLMCGAKGMSHCRQVVATVWGLGALFMLAVAGCWLQLRRRCSCRWLNRVDIALFWVRGVVVVYDEITDLLFVTRLVPQGNVHAVIVTGILLQFKHALVPLILTVTDFACAKSTFRPIQMVDALMERDKSMLPVWVQYSLIGSVEFAWAAYAVVWFLSVVSLGMNIATAVNMAQLTGPTMFCVEDASWLLKPIVFFSVPAMAFMLFHMLWAAIDRSFHTSRQEYTQRKNLQSYATALSHAEVWLECIPQALVQAILWGNGTALVTSQTWYIATALGSLTSIALAVAKVASDEADKAAAKAS